MKYCVLLILLAAIMLPFGTIAQTAVLNSVQGCQLNRITEVSGFITTSSGGYANLAVNYDGTPPNLVFTGIVTAFVKDENNLDTVFVDGDNIDVSGLTEAQINAMLVNNGVI